MGIRLAAYPAENPVGPDTQGGVIGRLLTGDIGCDKVF